MDTTDSASKYWIGTSGNTYDASGNWPRPWLEHIPRPRTEHITVTVPQVHIIERIIEKPQEDKPMRGLYQVTVVDPERDMIWDSMQAIAKSEGGAKLKALRVLDGLDDRDPDDLDIIVVRLGDVRAKREVQEVKVVTD